MDELMTSMFRAAEGFDGDIAAMVASITEMPWDPNGRFVALWTFITGIVNGAMIPAAGSLATFFFLVGFLKKTIMFEFVTMENVVKCLLRLVVAKIIIANSLIIVQGFGLVAHEILQDVIDLQLEGGNEMLSEGGIGKALSAEVQAKIAEFEGFGLIDKIFHFIYHIPMYLVLLVCKFFIFIQLWGRFLQICFYSVVAPLPLAGFIAEETTSFGVSFVKNYAAVLLQGFMIFLIVDIYILFNTSLEVGAFPLELLHVQLLTSIILVFMIAKSGNWAKQLMGL